jgi:hypothetical protein
MATRAMTDFRDEALRYKVERDDARLAASVLEAALDAIATEAAAAIATESVLDDKMALAAILRECQEVLR